MKDFFGAFVTREKVGSLQYVLFLQAELRVAQAYNTCFNTSFALPGTVADINGRNGWNNIDSHRNNTYSSGTVAYISVEKEDATI